jgi:hypothetical protein
MPPVPRPLFERLGLHISFPDDLDDCWNWIGAFSKKSRGTDRPVIQEAGRGSRILQVARVVLTFYKGPAPSPEHEAGHTCPGGENSRCVNPRHLEWMTRVENEQWKSRMGELRAEQSGLEQVVAEGAA